MDSLLTTKSRDPQICRAATETLKERVAKLARSALSARMSGDGGSAGVIRSAVAKRRFAAKLKRKIVKALEKMADKENEAIGKIILRALQQRLKKSARKKKRRQRRAN